MHIPSLKRYITITYKMFGDRQLSSYWVLGYIAALNDKKLITNKEFNILNNYNSKTFNKLFREEEKRKSI